jgi:Ca2+:H+ antiporter
MVRAALLVFVPVSLVLAWVVHAPPLAVFATASLAIVPLAAGTQRATEELAKCAGPAIGGLLNVTFGNVPELVIALFVLGAGKPEVVKGQITGAIIGNGLLGLGLAIVAGTWRRHRQTFNQDQAGLLTSLLFLCMIALLVPAMFTYSQHHVTERPIAETARSHLSVAVSIVLIGVYAANVLYTLVTHRDIFATHEHREKAEWSAWFATGVLVGTAALTAVEAELVSDALEPAADRLGLTPIFLGIVVLAIVGNVAEYYSAITFARRDDLGLAMAITIGSTIQVALLVAPLLVLLSHAIGHPMDLVFANPLELIAIAAVALVVTTIAHDGQATWFEGVMLLSVYAILAVAFFFAA